MMPLNVLFLCTGNSARSIMAESILRKDGAERFRAFSAGSLPKGAVNPFAIKVLGSFGYPVDGLTSKSWQTFAGPDAPSATTPPVRPARCGPASRSRHIGVSKTRRPSKAAASRRSAPS